MAKREREEDKRFYSHILFHRKQAVGFYLVATFVYICFVILITHHLTVNTHWTQLVVPLGLFSLPVIFFPMVESWDYQPWQGKPQKYERHYRD